MKAVCSFDERMLETPSIAIQSVVSEVCRMGYIVKGTMDKTRRVLFTQDEETMNEIREEESIATGSARELQII